ncbi:hypothetical protein [Microcoleus vaginatus]|uniref:hypothetical protein n=1 Tax=Microcoleus vaginatus TaxID=119532 RepID=UPI00404085B9
MTVHGVNSQPSTVNSELEFTIPMLTDLISGFLAPGPPVDRIFGAFSQVKALGLSKTVDHNQIHLNSCGVSLSVL